MPSLRTRSLLFWDFSSTERRRAAGRACSTGASPATTSTGRGTLAGWRWGRSSENSGKRCAAVFASRTQHEWSELFARADCCVSPILTVDEALENEQLRARKMIATDDGLTQLAFPLKFSEFEFRIGRPAPSRGEHTEEILREAGYRDAEIAALRGDGVI